MIISKGNPQLFPKLRGSIEGLRYPVYAETKIDGELNWLRHKPGNGNYLINKSGKMRSDCPITNDILIGQHDLLGELHWGDGKKGALYEFLKHQKDDALRFTIFDIDMPGSYIERRAILTTTISPTSNVSIIPVTIVKDRKEAMEAYRKYLDEEYEGSVFKSFDGLLTMGSCAWVKVKDKDTLDLEVVHIDPIRERIEVYFRDTANQMKAVHVGVKCLDKDKRTLKVGDIVEISHMGILSEGSLRSPIFLRKRED